MLWRVEYTDEFGVWWEGLSAAEQESVAASVGLLERLGPDLPFPHSSGVVGSRHGHMRELRVQHRGRPLRVLYAFDPRRVGLLLVGGDKTGDRRWYDVFVPVADRIYGDHIVALKTEHQRMSKSFEELRRKMPPARQSKARARTDTMVADLALAELRRNFGVTQEQLAGLLDIRQAAISKIERRDDVLLSTLTAYVRALGGELEIMARFGDHALRLKPASDPRPAIKLKLKRAPRAA